MKIEPAYARTSFWVLMAVCSCSLGLGGALIGAAAAVAAEPPPVAAYSFDEGEGTVVEDLYGEHDGAIEGASWFDNGRFGSALDFQGEKGECVTVPDAEDLRITEELTVEAWVKPRSPVSDDPVVFKSSWGYTGDGLGVGIANYGKPEGFIGEGEGEFESVVGTKALEPDVWTHLAFTYDGAHMRLYVNGELAATKAQAEGAPWGEGDLVIGCNPNYPSEVFDGLIDEVRIYNRALDQGQITSDAGAGLQTPQDTPVAAYSFDAGEGTVAEDVTGDEHEGAIEGAGWFDNGRFGKALSFDGENDCVTVEDAPDLQLTEELTLEAWVKPGGSGKSEPVIFKETPYFGTYSLYLGIGEEGHMEGLIGEEGYVFKDAEDPEKLEMGVWSHVALTFDGAHMRLYVNGQLVDTTAAEGAWSSSGPLSIGCSEEFEDNFEGKIDEVRIYNRALSAGELAADAGAGLQAPSRNPVAAYSFDAGEGTVADDVTGDGHDGAIEGASWFDNGRFGKALSFDGENDCVTVEDAPDLQLTEELTLEAWVKPKGSGASEPIIFKETPWFFGYSLYLGINEHGHMEGLIGEEGYESSVTEDPAKLETNVWSHIALTFDGSHMRLYVNGQLVDTTKAEGPWGTTGPLSIGCSEEFEDNYKGLIDEVRIYNRALSAGELALDEQFDLAGPNISLSGSATEPLPEGTGTYPLEIMTSDGSSDRTQAGVVKVEVAVDSEIQTVYSQHCPDGSCTMNRTWEYDPANFPGVRHQLEVTAFDAVGNSSTKTIDATIETENIPLCSDSQAPPTPYSTKPLPDGGTSYLVSRGEMVEETPYPPEGFDPLIATAEELEEYGLPPRPPKEEGLGEWTEMMEHWDYSQPGPPDPCSTGSASSRRSTGSLVGSKRRNPIWSGVLATSPGVNLGYQAASTQFVQPASHPTDCDPSTALVWVGIGGTSEQALIQAGTRIASDNKIRAFWEYLGAGGAEGVDLQVVPRSRVHIDSGDEVFVSVRWNASHSVMHFYWFDFDAPSGHKHFAKVIRNLKNESRFFHGDTADFIVERETREGPLNFENVTGLKNFKSVIFGLTRATKTNGSHTKLGEDLPEEYDMYSNGHPLAENEGVAKSGLAFSDQWRACH